MKLFSRKPSNKKCGSVESVHQYVTKWPLLDIRIVLPFIFIETQLISESLMYGESTYISLEVRVGKWGAKFKLYDTWKRIRDRAVCPNPNAIQEHFHCRCSQSPLEPGSAQKFWETKVRR